MKFIIEFRLKPGSKTKVVEIFEQIGPNRNPGVKFGQAWVGTRSDLIFVVGESADESLVATVCQSWAEHGDYQIHPVIDIEQF